jgi:uncharacterized protein (TIGR03437 family)
MTGTRKIVAAAIAGGCVFSLLLYAHAEGPDPRHTAAPGDDPLACTTSGCHVGTPLNGGGGNVAVSFPNGLKYTPGEKQTFTITITDSAARKWGFQMTARLESNLSNGQAGDFTAGTGQIVICDDASFKQSKGCPANKPVQFIEHYIQPFNTNVISVSWTAPATNVGNVHIYVAANAANGNTLETGDHIYAANYTLCPKASPTISAVVSASGFNANAGLASGTWLEIYGTGLSCSTRGWAGNDFVGSNAPTGLDNVSVTIGGIKAFVDYVSPGQVNVQAPEDSKTGAEFPVVVQNDGGTSAGFPLQKNAIAPALLGPSSFIVGGKQYVVAQHLDQSYVGKAGLIAGLNFKPAVPGETITIFGIGFGPVTPSSPAGVIAAGSTSLVTKPTFRFGQTAATLGYYGLTPGLVGLYQFNVVVPNVSSGDQQLNVDVGGTTVNQPLFITVQ